MSLWTKFRLARNRISVYLWKVHQLPRSYFNLFLYSGQLLLQALWETVLRRWVYANFSANGTISDWWSMVPLLIIAPSMWFISIVITVSSYWITPLTAIFFSILQVLQSVTASLGSWMKSAVMANGCLLAVTVFYLVSVTRGMPLLSWSKCLWASELGKWSSVNGGSFDATDKLLIRRQSYIYWASNTENCSSIINWNQPSFGLLQCKTIVTIFGSI